MGGKAFEGGSIVTPRMPTKVYRETLEQVEGVLSTLFEAVAHAIEGPEKTTHGDLDILIVPHSDSPTPSVEVIARLLGAVKWISWQKNGVAQFAIPWPEETEDIHPADTPAQALSELAIWETKDTNGSGTPVRSKKRGTTVEKCIQLDLNRFSNLQDMRWQLFNTSHGDLCNILSNIVRSKGLTINTEALYLRIASVEKYNRKAGRIELSRNPEQVLQYFGLDPTRFWQPFSTLDEMMTYAATSRFFRPKRQRVDNDEASLNWTDQKYLNVRPIFTYWINTFLPAHKDDEPGKDAHLTREEVLDDVFAFFGDNIKQAYETQKRKADTEVARQFLWPNVRAAIRETQPDLSEDDMNDTIKALKRIAQYDFSHINDQYATLRQAYRSEDYTTVISWAAQHHSDVQSAYRSGSLEDMAVPTTASTSDSMTPAPRHPCGSTRPTETYTKEDDEVIKYMKEVEGATWPEIMKVLGKESKSQLVAHYKQYLQAKVGVAGEDSSEKE